VRPGDATIGTVSARRDTAAVPRAVVRLQELVVRGRRVHDLLSTQTVHVVPHALARTLPVDRTADLIALQAGVIARGEQLHVRGGRAGESRTALHGIGLDEPLRGRSIELPRSAVREVELASGGYDADLGGALAGVISYRTVDPGDFSGELAWRTDGQLDTHYDQASARVGGRLFGIGLVASGEATLDDTHLPNLRTTSRRDVLGASFGWRAQNRMLGHLKLMTGESTSRLVFELLANRRVDRPFNPMWSLDGFTQPCQLPSCSDGPAFSPVAQPGYSPYRAADHLTMSDTRAFAALAAWTGVLERTVLRASAGAVAWRRTTSLNGREDDSYVTAARHPQFGISESDRNDPFYAYLGDEPYFDRQESMRYTVRADAQRTTASEHLIKAGAGLTWDRVDVHEFDLSSRGTGLDSIRAYRASAPGGFAYAHGRWGFEGLVVNGGLRLEAFTPGSAARDQSFPVEPETQWSLSPRLGMAYPISTRDVFSVSYVRVQQSPDRDYLYDNRDLIINRQPIGNPSLVPATMIAYQAAVKHVFDEQWSLQASVFYRDLWDLVGSENADPDVDIAQLQYKNLDNGSAGGFELSLRGIGDRDFLEIHYTILDARGTSSLEEGEPFGAAILRRPPSLAPRPLDWDLRHSISFAASRQWTSFSTSWITQVGSGLPWTPAERRVEDVDRSDDNSRRLSWGESTSLAVRWLPGMLRRHLAIGVEVRNLFDHRGDLAATLSGYPHPVINTRYDDYGAYRTETGQGGGAYSDDIDGDGVPGWVPVHDPRLGTPPRTVRALFELSW
jgi:outer membrane receptor protein involved in Fe transport